MPLVIQVIMSPMHCHINITDQCIQGCMAEYSIPFVDTIYSQSNKFVTGVKIKVAGDSNLTTTQISHGLRSPT